jgi:Ran GTPase-activating protein (RanGAP) involved in mRNA processing and transport
LMLKSIGGYIIMDIDSTYLRRGNVAVLAEMREIRISNIGQGPPAYTDENWDILAEVIRTTTSLEKLVFEKDAVIALQNDKIADALVQNGTIKELNLWAADFGDRRAKAVAAILKKNSTIESVYLALSKISKKGAKAIADALKHNKSLRYISLGGNEIGVEGAKAIAEALKENASLQTIGLSRNQIGNEGATAIADALKKNTSLETIYLSSNEIGVDGVKAISEALKDNTCLQVMDLENNKIGNEGAKAIAEAIKKNTSLQTLDIWSNNIGEKGGKHILNALQQTERSAIENINLGGDNKVSKETQTKIKQEIIRIQNRSKGVGANEGQVGSVATAAGKSQGVQNKRSSNEDEGINTIHPTNTSQSSAENVKETNRTGLNTTVVETEVEHLKSTITQLQSKIEEQDKELASTKDILKTIGNLANGKDGGATINTESSMPDRETELQSEIERYKEENNSLKQQLKNSRPIETVDLTNEIEPATSSGGEDSTEEPPSKRQRTKSNLAVALEQTQQLVEVKEEAKERASVAEANVAVARRERDAAEASLRDKQEDLEDSEELVTQQTLATNILQGRIDELCELARAAGVDGSLLSEIRYRPLSSGR